MDSPPLGPNPKSSLPSRLVNGTSPLHLSREVRDQKERDNLRASIKASNTGRHVVDLDDPNGYFPKKSSPESQDSHGTKTSRRAIDEDYARDPHDEVSPPTLSTTRPTSPFTQHPTIDFDGLSWPSTASTVFTYTVGLTHH
jgi:GTP cyclohydrolase IA